jgi:hypothetical protein
MVYRTSSSLPCLKAGYSPEEIHFRTRLRGTVLASTSSRKEELVLVLRLLIEAKV